jgi:predicted Zn finger-like uncharacterized protein
VPISIACPTCSAKFQVPDASVGARGKCHTCGTVIQVPAKPQKFCCACGIDVAGQPRTKDAEGRYFCNPCWTEHQNAVSEPDDNPAPAGEFLACPQCSGVFGIDEMDVSGVCIRCAASPTAAQATSRKSDLVAKTSFWKTDTGVITAILIPLLLIGGAIGGWFLWSSHVERQVLNEIARLKEIGDQRLAGGEAEAASAQYAKLLAYAKKEAIDDGESGMLAEVRRQKDRADADARRQKEIADAKAQDDANRKAAELRRRESAAGDKFLNDVGPFLIACKRFRAAYEEYSRRGNAIVGADGLKAAIDSERQMLDAMHALAKDAKGVQSAYDSIPKDLEHTQTLCNVISAAASDLTTAYDKHSSAPGDMARLRLAAMTGASADVDPQTTQRNYATLVSTLYSMAGIAVDTAAIIGSSANASAAARNTSPASSETDSVASGNVADDPATCRDAEQAYRRGVDLLKGEGAQASAPLGFRWLQRSAELGHAPAATVLGHLYRNGTFIQQDDSTGAKWFRKGAEGGDADAMTLLAICLAKGEGLERNLPEAVKWYRAATDKGNLNAMHNLAVMYLQGDGVTQSEDEGRKLLRRAAEGGNAMSMEVLGQVAAKKQNGAVSRNAADAAEATEHWRKARSFQTGKGVPRDEAAAIQWYTKAGNLGHADAMFKLGAMYAAGTGVQRNQSQAVRWYRSAIAAGNTLAMVNLGVMFEYGPSGLPNEDEESAPTGRRVPQRGVIPKRADTGVTKDVNAAAKLYQQAAELGNSMGMFNLARAYENGQGMPQDYQKALHWYKESSLHGYTDAMRNLHDLYVFGKGVTKDVEEGERWMRRAAEMGNKEAAEFMKKIDYARRFPQDLMPVAKLLMEYLDAQREYDLFRESFQRLSAQGDQLKASGQYAGAQDAYQAAINENRQAAVRLERVDNLLPQLARLPADSIERVRQHLLGDNDFPAEMRPFLEKYHHSQSSSGTPQSAVRSKSPTNPTEARTVRCPDCNGTGQLSRAERQRLTSAAMAAAAGTGGSAKVDIKCRTCGGTGSIAQ